MKDKSVLNVLTYGYLPWTYPPNWWRNIKQFFRNLKYAYQRVIYGYCDQDTWNLYNYYTILMIQSLKNMNENKCGHPFTMTEDSWTDAINEIISHLQNSDEDYADSPYYKAVWDNFDAMTSYVTKTELVPCEDNPGCSRMVETYSDEAKYNEAREKWFNAEKVFSEFRDSEKNKALEMLKKYWYNLWD